MSAYSRGSNVNTVTAAQSAFPHSFGQVEPVSHPRFGEDVLRFLGRGLDFLAQLLDEGAQVLVAFAVFPPPHGAQDLAVREGPVGVFGEIMQNLEPPGRQVNGLPLRTYMAFTEVDLYPIKGENAGAGVHRGGIAPQGGADPRQQFRNPRGFDHIIVGPRIQSGNNIPFLLDTNHDGQLDVKDLAGVRERPFVGK